MNEPLLEVKDLVVEYSSGKKAVHAVNGISLSLAVGQTLGLVGETGAGKTTIAKSILRILPAPQGTVKHGSILFHGKNLLEMDKEEIRSVRGGKISMIFQDPMTSLNPVMRVIDQIAEGIRVHQAVSKAESERLAVKMLNMVGISTDRAYDYPHQFSGGMKQRVVIAMALSCEPELLLADEPTTALDVTIQAQVLELIGKLKQDYKTSLLMITHDLGVVAEVCDYVAVIYAGRIVEYGTKLAVFDHPSHPYTVGLFNSIPDLQKDVDRLSPIKGLPPDPTNLPKGCPFSPRCPFASEACHREVPLLKALKEDSTHYCRCVREA